MSTPPPAAPGGSAAPWVSARDASSGVGFAVPAGYSHTSKPGRGFGGTAVDQRTYSGKAAPGITLSVSVTTSTGTPITWSHLEVVSQELRQQFVDQGVQDVQVLDERAISQDGYSGQEFRFSFQPVGAPRAGVVWLVRVLGVGTALVTVQTISFPANAASVPRVLGSATAIQDRAIDALTLP